MEINGKHYRTIWLNEEDHSLVQIIDQRWLPHQFVIEDIHTMQQMATAIRDMHLRGAPCIGAAAAWGMYLAALQSREDNFKTDLQKAAQTLQATRPTAVDLFNTLTEVNRQSATADSQTAAVQITKSYATRLCDDSAERCRMIGQHGLALLQDLYQKKPDQPVNILTHCNAGWIACVDYGTATSPIYAAHRAGIPVHVWVDETRPRNQGARLTAYELLQEGVPHTVITDNAGGLLMQRGQVDLVIVGSDRTTRTGDVANKIGTYLKALAAKDNQIPFYVALPCSSFDWELTDGVREIPIEERNEQEVRTIQGKTESGKIVTVQLTPDESPALNLGFDVTPAHLVTGLITERGICAANEEAILRLFPEKTPI